jgi:hypothetical protein
MNALDRLDWMLDRFGIARTAHLLGVTRRTLEKWRAGTHGIGLPVMRLLVLYTERPTLARYFPLRDAATRRIVSHPPDRPTHTE